MATSPQFRQKNSNFWPFRNMEFFDPLGEKKKLERICFNNCCIGLVLSREAPSELGDSKGKMKKNRSYLTKYCLK